MPSIHHHNGESSVSLAGQFDALVAQIEAEEAQSASALHPPLPEEDLEHEHRIMLASANALASHQQMKQMHAAMFKVHRKVHQRHQLAMHHCRLLQARVRTGGYSVQELREIVREVQRLLVRIRHENEQMVRDRTRIRTEHDAFMASLPPPPPN